tara:strand:- start:429 stop:2744 length:2316 start_codon:yes stop_codon:yes gene_type:complete
MKYLLIVESPAKCKKIEGYLGNEYKCIASFGHIRKIQNGLKSIDYNDNYKPTFCITPEKRQQIKKIKSMINKVDEVLLATDDDREGEAIAWHLCKVFNLSIPNTKRIIFHEITKTAILEAVNNPIRLNMDKVESQLARQVLDLMVGYTITPVLWKNISRFSESGLSAGRCQSPALRLIYDQKKLIDSNPGTFYYNTTGYFTKKNIEFTLNTQYKNKEEMETFLEDSVDFDYEYSVSDPVKISKAPPRPLTTSTLQQKSSNVCGYSPKQTMRLAQTLYENGLITYMRTDNGKYSVDFIKKSMGYIKGKHGDEYVNPKIFALSLKSKTKKNKNAQEAHEAIRPTNVNLTTINTRGKITNKEKRLYELIWKITVQSCMSHSTYDKITSTITAPNKGKYKTHQEKLLFPGWEVLNKQVENKIYPYLLSYRSEGNLTYNKINSKYALKNMKTRFTEARLINELEKKGIGRPSTYSNIISKIQDRKYVLKANVEGRKLKCIDFELIGDELEEIENTREFGKENNKLVIQPTGTMVIEFLIKHFDDFFNYNYTSSMEASLDEIAEGNKVWHYLCNECNNDMKTEIKKITNDRICYKIDEYHTYLIGRYGPVVKYDKDGEQSFKSVKKNLDMEKLKNNEYSLKEILDETSKNNSIKLGQYKGDDVVLKNGKYGIYFTYKKKNHSVKYIDEIKHKKMEDITIEDIGLYLTKMNMKDFTSKSSTTVNKNIIREINKDISIRKGKYGNYVFYKTSKMKKPKFIKIKKINEEDIDEAWVMSQL